MSFACFRFRCETEGVDSDVLSENVENNDSKGKDDAFKKLELDEVSKELLKNLVMQHNKKIGYF